MLTELREATASSHDRLDAAFGTLDLTSREGFARFLVAHALGMSPLFETCRGFAKDRLAIACPDYPAMLAADLAALGVEVASLPSLAPAADPGGDTGADGAAGVAYVIGGSRLGLAMLRKGGYFGQSDGRTSRYMEDEGGLALWRALVPVLRAPAPAAETGAACTAALAAFETFARAFEASGEVAAASFSPSAADG